MRFFDFFWFGSTLKCLIFIKFKETKSVYVDLFVLKYKDFIWEKKIERERREESTIEIQNKRKKNEREKGDKEPP